ncbi:MAG: hypothetical protein IPN64_09900 [Propionivibrio sp.]|nr:hypothetical protein [Propionivibrio sp.]
MYRWRNRLNTEIFLPALVFSALATRRFDAGLDGWLIAATAIIVIGSGVVALPIARWMRVDAKLFCPPMMFSNCGTLGLPLALLAFGEREFPHAMLAVRHHKLDVLHFGCVHDRKRSVLAAHHREPGGHGDGAGYSQQPA